MDVATAIARGVAAERARSRLTQHQLAAALGLPQSAISAIESGSRAVSAVELVELCRVLHAPLHRLLASADQADLDVLGIS